jgi:hypothetical protein
MIGGTTKIVAVEVLTLKSGFNKTGGIEKLPGSSRGIGRACVNKVDSDILTSLVLNPAQFTDIIEDFHKGTAKSGRWHPLSHPAQNSNRASLVSVQRQNVRIVLKKDDAFLRFVQSLEFAIQIIQGDRTIQLRTIQEPERHNLPQEPTHLIVNPSRGIGLISQKPVPPI